MSQTNTTGSYQYKILGQSCFRIIDGQTQAEEVEYTARNRLLALRSLHRLSQSELAKVLGISVRSLQEYEQSRKNVSAAVATLIEVFEENPEIVKRRIFKYILSN